MSVPVEPGLLKLMFAPHLGMFIAPGCDGLRGVSTMLCLSLIVGHYYRMRPAQHGMFVLLSIVLTADVNDANQHEVEQTLRMQMARFLADVDFNPAIRVVALQTAP